MHEMTTIKTLSGVMVPRTPPAPPLGALVTFEYAGVVENEPLYRVVCRECGDVTRSESGGTVNDASIKQTWLYRQRHLDKHLQALVKEIGASIG